MLQAVEVAKAKVVQLRAQANNTISKDTQQHVNEVGEEASRGWWKETLASQDRDLVRRRRTLLVEAEVHREEELEARDEVAELEAAVGRRQPAEQDKELLARPILRAVRRDLQVGKQPQLAIQGEQLLLDGAPEELESEWLLLCSKRSSESQNDASKNI